MESWYVGPGSVRTALAPSTVSWAASRASTGPPLETALVSQRPGDDACFPAPEDAASVTV